MRLVVQAVELKADYLYELAQVQLVRYSFDLVGILRNSRGIDFAAKKLRQPCHFFF